MSQALTLFTTPVIYIYLDRLSSYLGTFSSREVAEVEPAQRPAAAE